MKYPTERQALRCASCGTLKFNTVYEREEKTSICHFLLLLISTFIFWEVYIRLYHSAVSYIQPPDKTYIKDKMWSYDGGFRVGGDFIIFKDPQLYRLQGDTIFYKDKPQALITRLNKYLYQMTVSSMDGKQKGNYTNVEERLQ